jgi:hypothetical protein
LVVGGSLKYLYHITDVAKLDSIKKSGLSPEFSISGPGVYLSQDECHVRSYEGHNGKWERGTILRIRMTGIDKNLLEADDADYPDLVGEDYDEKNWKDSLKVSGQCMYLGKIDPKNIECLTGNGVWKKLIPIPEKINTLSRRVTRSIVLLPKIITK